MTARVLVRRATAMLTLAFVAACSSDDPSGPSGNFTLSAPASATTVAAGSGGRTTLTLGRSGGFDGAVSLTIDNASNGVTASINPGVATSNVTSVAVDYAVAGSVDTASAPTITVRATSPGRPDQTAIIKLKVTATPKYTVNFPSITLPAEGSKSFKVSINRLNNFNGVVDFQFSDLPAGVTGTFATISGPGSGSGDSAIVTLTARPVTGSCSATSPPSGTRTVHLRSLNGQVDSISTAVALTIADAPSYNTVITPCNARIFAPGTTPLTVALTRFGGFTAPVDFTVLGLPADVTAAPVTAADNSATINLVTTETTLASSQTIQIRGRTAGIADRTANYTLNVTGFLKSGVVLSGLNGPINTFRYYRVVVPAGATKLVMQTGTTSTTASGTDIDIAVRGGALPDYNNRIFDCVAETGSAAETCTINNPTPGDYYMVVIGFTAYTGIQALATVTVPAP